MRCAACGATNPDSAAWCGQCYQRFDEAATTPAAARNGHSPTAAQSPAEAQSTAAASTGFRREGDDVLWECPQCNAENPIDLASCAVCGTSLLERFAAHTPDEPRNWNAALGLTLVAPGAGHLAVGRPGSGLARLLLYWSWLMGAVLLLSQGSGTMAVATPLLLGAVVVWAGSLIDLLRLRQGESEFLVGRGLLWLVVAVLVLLGMGLVAATGASAPSTG